MHSFLLTVEQILLIMLYIKLFDMYNKKVLPKRIQNGNFSAVCRLLLSCDKDGKKCRYRSR